MEHLIANSGIQFITQKIEFNPSEPLAVSGGQPLKYSFCEIPDIFTGGTIFDLLCYNPAEQCYIPYSELAKNDKFERLPNGTVMVNDAGLQRMDPGESVTFYTTIRPDDPDGQIINISNLASYKVFKSPQDKTRVTAFSKLLDQWLPMPMFEKNVTGYSCTYPFKWCRVKISPVSEPDESGKMSFRIIWAFDTTISDMSLDVPYFDENDVDTKEFSLCNMTALLMNFMFKGENDDGTAGSLTEEAENVAYLLGLDLNNLGTPKYQFVAYYIYLINFLRLRCGMEVALSNKPHKMIDVDMAIDIGNSRTCGVLFHNGEFTQADMLEIRNITQPWKTYNKPFDMHVVFRKADFGNVSGSSSDLFQWKSLVRVGEEATDLMYRSLEDEGLSETRSNYSSPKRYLWDTKPFDGKWNFLISKDDPLNIRVMDAVFIKNVTSWFADDGEYTPKENLMPAESCRYSRSSLMTFVFIEVFLQAYMQINSIEYRRKRGDVDCPRRLRNIIITAPTAMPNQEQVRLRQCAVDAYNVIKKSYPWLKDLNIIPKPSMIKTGSADDDGTERDWTYDEATASQFVYLYSEVAEKYKGEIHRLFESKGHVRPEFAKLGYKEKSLTIGSVDIGAGTTDLMICSYQYQGGGRINLTPVPLFWDSFYLAGDDILNDIVLNVVIERRAAESDTVGSILSILERRLAAMTDEQISAIPVIARGEKSGFSHDLAIIRTAATPSERIENVRKLARDMVFDYFGTNAWDQGYRDRRCRVDFNTQVSMPIARFMLELLRLRRPSKVYTFDDIFPVNVPADYLLQHFRDHFGFDIREIEWRFDPDAVASIVSSKMEQLMKQLSIILHSFNIDVLVLAGRPTSLYPITDLFLKYLPVSPDRLVMLNDYRPGRWYPLSSPEGYFLDQKSIVAVGAMVGYMASSTGFGGMNMDFRELVNKMRPTANYLGQYDSEKFQVPSPFMAPRDASAEVEMDHFPYFIGCKQLNSVSYQARPLYAIYNNSSKNLLKVTFERNFDEDNEKLSIESVTDQDGNEIPASSVDLVQQSLADDGKFWLDTGEFKYL